MQVRAVWPRLMALAPTPEAACAASPDALEATIHSLGFHRSRARSIGAMSHDYLHTAWSRPSQLRFVGKYASDAYFIFCRCAPLRITALLQVYVERPWRSVFPAAAAK